MSNDSEQACAAYDVAKKRGQDMHASGVTERHCADKASTESNDRQQRAFEPDVFGVTILLTQRFADALDHPVGKV